MEVRIERHSDGSGQQERMTLRQLLDYRTARSATRRVVSLSRKGEEGGGKGLLAILVSAHVKSLLDPYCAQVEQIDEAFHPTTDLKPILNILHSRKQTERNRA